MNANKNDSAWSKNQTYVKRCNHVTLVNLGKLLYGFEIENPNILSNYYNTDNKMLRTKTFVAQQSEEFYHQVCSTNCLA